MEEWANANSSVVTSTDDRAKRRNGVEDIVRSLRFESGESMAR
jgi:hypothetical protein